MNGNFEPIQVGEGVGEGCTTLVNTSNWNTPNELWFTNVQLTDEETKVIEGFGTAGLIVLYPLFTVCRLIWPILQSFGVRNC